MMLQSSLTSSESSKGGGGQLEPRQRPGLVKKSLPCLVD